MLVHLKSITYTLSLALIIGKRVVQLSIRGPERTGSDVREYPRPLVGIQVGPQKWLETEDLAT